MSKETSLQRSENRGSKQHKKHMNICSIEEASEFIRRLDAIIALLTLAVPGSLGEKIVFFHEAGLRPAEIAEILGKNLSYI